MQIALKRLSPKESYDRVYRLRRSIQCSYQHKLLPKDQWTKPEEVCNDAYHESNDASNGTNNYSTGCPLLEPHPRPG